MTSKSEATAAASRPLRTASFGDETYSYSYSLAIAVSNRIQTIHA